jgi:drug/metabolite transporter (DMT)-like permease
LTIVALRVAIGALCLHGAALVLGWQLPRGRDVWIALAIMGVLNNAIPFTLIVWGQTQIAGGLAAILNATTPLFTVVTAHFLTRDEPMTAAGLAGVILGLAGAIVLNSCRSRDMTRKSWPAALQQTSSSAPVGSTTFTTASSPPASSRSMCSGRMP